MFPLKRYFTRDGSVAQDGGELAVGVIALHLCRIQHFVIG